MLATTKIAADLAALSAGGVVAWGLLLALAIEIATSVLRFGFGMKATESTAFLAGYTAGLRIHHGYVGVALLLVSFALADPAWRKGALVAGIGLVVSDLAHHFLVLWLLTGHHEFYFRYPKP
ncbi:MAG: hypothetical protein FJY73_12555 [Candidatus Eisenbacteria bacterium]|nr:hypothetical protein [Candidatus Eisenbacteria bacterium]